MNVRGFLARRWRRVRRKIVAMLADPPVTVAVRASQPPLPRPGGLDKPAILAALSSISIDGSNAAEMAAYADADCERFIRTVDLIPPGAGDVLEIGAGPYFTSLLMRWFRPDIRADYTNFFAATDGRGQQHVTVRNPSGADEAHVFDYANLNIEGSAFPYPDASFDGVLFCEVIEHMQMDPLRALREIRRVLKPDGWLILTTPNVARLANVVKMINGGSIYDPYSAYGAYGRHNREYSLAELRALLRFAGFEPDAMFTADVHDARHGDLNPPAEIAALLKHREDQLGAYLFSRSRKMDTAKAGKPSWLYQSYPPGEISPEPFPD